MTPNPTHAMAPLSRVLPALAVALAALSIAPSAEAQTRDRNAPQTIRVTDASNAREIRLQISKSAILELPRDAADILVSNPSIGNAIVRSQRRIFLLGTGIGSTNIFFFDAEGRQIAAIDLVVERDLEGLNRMLRRIFPANTVRAEGIGENVVITGTVNSPVDAQQAINVAERFVGQLSSSAPQGAPAGGAAGAAGGAAAAPAGGGTGAGGSRVINALTIIGKDQIQLRVVVAEVNRRAARQLGVDLNGLSMIAGRAGTAFGAVGGALSSAFPLNPSSTPATGTLGIPQTSQRGFNLTSTLRALEEVGMFKTLAEPNLTAVSGEQATFLAGGEFPIPVSRDITGNVGIEFRPFGVSLMFTPVVLSEGRISLKVRTEVSELSNRGLILQNFNIPGFNVRRADSTVELPSGGSIAIAGLIRDDMRKVITGVPLLRQLPILGRLFSSQDFISEQTELVVIVTPYVVNPVSRRELSTPVDGFSPPSDPEALLFGRLNRTMPRAPNGTGAAMVSAPPANVQRRFGFIYE